MVRSECCFVQVNARENGRWSSDVVGLTLGLHRVSFRILHLFWRAVRGPRKNYKFLNREDGAFCTANTKGIIDVVVSSLLPVIRYKLRRLPLLLASLSPLLSPHSLIRICFSSQLRRIRSTGLIKKYTRYTVHRQKDYPLPVGVSVRHVAGCYAHAPKPTQRHQCVQSNADISQAFKR